MAMKHLVKLRPIDVRKCNSASEIVDAMRYCSFGARMTGEVIATMCKLVASPHRPVIIYDGKKNTPLGQLLCRMGPEGFGYFSEICTPQEYVNKKSVHGNIRPVVVGTYPECLEDVLIAKHRDAIFINQYGIIPQGFTQDGYFPNVVFADPRFVIPLMQAVFTDHFIDPLRRTIPSNIPSVVDWMGQFGGLAAEVRHGAQTLKDMVRDKNCTVFFTASGAMTIAQMGLLFCDLIDEDMIQGVATTGAFMAHGLIQSVGLPHYKYNPRLSDKMLAGHGINRVTDTLEPETNFDHLEKVLRKVFADLSGKPRIGSVELHHAMGEYLAEHIKGRGILKSAYEKRVPVFVPAITDSEIWNDLFTFNRMQERKKRNALAIDMEQDTKRLLEMALDAKTLGIFSVGGGVPRNNVQNVAPLIELMTHRLEEDFPTTQFSYGCRIAPDPMYFGHLTGCTYFEGMSWKKMNPDGQFSEMHTDATIVLPFLVKYLLETV